VDAYMSFSTFQSSYSKKNIPVIPRISPGIPFKIGNDDFVLQRISKTERINKGSRNYESPKYENKKQLSSLSYREKTGGNPNSQFRSWLYPPIPSVFQNQKIMSPTSSKVNNEKDLKGRFNSFKSRDEKLLEKQVGDNKNNSNKYYSRSSSAPLLKKRGIPKNLFILLFLCI
jgi:hypothetical protein